jgi:hypothetical protein
MTDKTRVGKAIGSSLQNLPAPIAALAMQFGGLSAAWGLGIAAATGLLATFRELAEDRGKELQEFIEAHKDEFVEEIVNSPEFVAVFVNVWNEHIRETSENKRARLRNFMLGVGSGQPISTDMHTKIYNIIEQMTDQEADSFGALRRGVGSGRLRQLHFMADNIPELYSLSDEDRKYVLHSLHSYRLINITEATVDGVIAIKQITPFGFVFYDYVLNTPNQ